MILDIDDVVLVSNRRMFPQDEARHFLGRIIARDGELVKVQGYSYVRDLSTGHVVKKTEKRIKVLSLASAGFIVYQLPAELNPETASIESGNGDAILVDGRRQIMNLSERTHCGHF
ncbi:MAG: hypothetical protein RIK87_10725 [Fuerstiella sp.]